MEASGKEDVKPTETFFLKNRGGSVRPPACPFSVERPWPGPGASLEVKRSWVSRVFPILLLPGLSAAGERWTLKPLPLWGQDHGTLGPNPWPQQPASAETLIHPAALTKLSLNGRCARHHVWSPFLHSGRRAFPEPEGRAAAPCGGQSCSSCRAVWDRSRPGSLGGHPHRVPLGL